MNNKNNIAEFYGKMPIHKAPENIWDTISGQLDVVDTRLGLPVHVADEALWSGIERRLNSRKPNKGIIRFVGSVAATIVLIFSLTIVLQNRANNPQIILSEEMVETHSFAAPQTTPDAHSIIHRCNEFPLVCESDEFNTLKKQIDRLKQQRNDLQSFGKFDADPEISQYIERINNDISRLETKILAMF